MGRKIQNASGKVAKPVFEERNSRKNSRPLKRRFKKYSYFSELVQTVIIFEKYKNIDLLIILAMYIF